MINRVFIKLGYLLLLTIIFELVFSIILGVRKKKDLLNIILVNIATNPILNSIMIIVYLKSSYIVSKIILIVLEIFIVFIEGFIYKKCLSYNKINGILLSFLLNLFSFIMGVLIFGF